MMKANKKMRKNMIKKASMTALAATLSLSAALPAFAATLDFSGESNTGHSYNVYQIFTGKFEEVEGNKELKEMYYGVDAKAYVAGEEKRVDSAVITELEGVSGKTTAEILKVVEAYAEIDGSSFQTAKAGDVLTDIPDGYYLIEDAEAPSNGDSFTTYVVKVVGGTIKVTPKTDKPGFDKQVLDNEKDDVTENAGQTVEENTQSDKGGYWGETADHAIGESFQFRLTATLPKSDTIDNYKSYYMAFHDTMSKELSFESIDKVVVTYTDANGQKQTKVITNYTDTTAALTETPDAEQKWSLEIMDLKAELDGGSLSEAQVDVIYNAHLNENAAISVDEKGNDDNQNNARLEYGNNPTWESNGKDKPDDTEETPDDTVFVFTYDVKNFKTKEDGTTPLAKAKFSVFTKDNDKTPINLIHVGEKDGYDTYRLAKAGETGVVTEIETSDSGKFRVIGLDAGAYVLKETFAPAGYVAAEDMDIEITTEHKENEDKETAELAKFTRTLNGEAFDENKIINEKGSKLPETGGMGTMLFYLLGGTMALGASGTLVFRKRISRK